MLRPYQSRLVYEVQKLFALGERRILMQLSTGGGKTQIAAELVRLAGSRRVLYVVPSIEIFSQTARRVREAVKASPVELLAGQHPDLSRAKYVLAMSHTLARRIKAGTFTHWQPDLIFVDEAHKLFEQHRKLLAHWPKVPVVAQTATPTRLDGRPLAALWPVLVTGPSVRQLASQGHLVPCTTIRAPKPDLRGVRITAGDYSPDDLDEAYADAALIREAPIWWQKYARGRRTIAFCSGVKSSRKLCEAYKEAGVRAVHVDGETPPAAREAALAALRRHDVDVVCNCALFVEGLDIPEIGAIQYLTSTLSIGRWLQSCGRGLRPSAGKKDLVLLDHGGNAERHDTPDADRDWYDGGTSLDVAKKVCLCCEAFIDADKNLCPVCYRKPSAPMPDRLGAHAARSEEGASRATPPRACPPAWTACAPQWAALERDRHRHGWPLSYPAEMLRRAGSRRHS